MDTTVILVTILIALQLSSTQGKTYKFKSSCYDNPLKTLDMECGPNEMLRIVRAFYGYSPTNKCSFSPGDCTFDEHQNYACVGRTSCSINMPGGLGRSVPKCPHGKHQSNYFQVEYECVKVTDTNDICSTTMLTEQSGYISSPSYPLNYHKERKCQVSIKLAHKQELSLYIVDMNLRRSEDNKGCMDDLYISNDLRTVTVCGQRGFEKIFDSSNSQMDILFTAQPGGDNKGFWLYYEAYPMIEKTEPITTTTPKGLLEKITGENPLQESEVKIESEKPVQSEQVDTKPSQEHLSTNPPQSNDELPFAAIVGGVIGSLCFVLTILLILLLLQRLRERREQEQKKHLPFLDVRNQAFQSNSELCSQDGYYC